MRAADRLLCPHAQPVTLLRLVTAADWANQNEKFVVSGQYKSAGYAKELQGNPSPSHGNSPSPSPRLSPITLTLTLSLAL
jgi:hypothetical protein